MLKISGLVWASKSCYVIYSLVEKNINIQQALLFSLLAYKSQA